MQVIFIVIKSKCEIQHVFQTSFPSGFTEGHFWQVITDAESLIFNNEMQQATGLEWSLRVNLINSQALSVG